MKVKTSIRNAVITCTFLGATYSDGNFKKEANVIIIDLSEVDDEIVELVTSFIGRSTFDALRSAEPRNKFPIHLVLEEAHRYISEKPSRFSIDASKIFERIAKEGRKYGLFLVLASQRPSELSKTVLSQCANFIVHRIQNPDDLSQIRQMTPSISEAILKRLPTLPKQHALLFGSAVNLQTTFKVRDAKPTPDSRDAQISNLWYRSDDDPLELNLKKPRKINDTNSSPSQTVHEKPQVSQTTSDQRSPSDMDDEIPF